MREKLKLRLIQPSWSFYGREFGTEKWSHRGRLAKIVHRPGPAIEWEQDYYYSGAKYVVDPFTGDTDDERVTVTYDYGRQTYFVVYLGGNRTLKAICETGLSSDKHGETGPKDVVLSAADQILAAWGQSRR